MSQEVFAPSELVASLEAAELTLADMPRGGLIELRADLTAPGWWWVVEVLVTSDDGRRVGFTSGDAAREVKVIPFVGALEPLKSDA